MSNNIVKSIDQIKTIINASTADGLDKVNALDLLKAGITTSLADLNLIDAALGGAGNFTSINAALADIATKIAGFAPVGGVTSGTYLPVASALVNLSLATPLLSQFIRVGPTVAVYGSMNLTATAALTPTSVKLSLPVASNLATGSDLAGSMTVDPAAILGTGIFGDAADLALFTFNSVTNTGPNSCTFTFGYRILP